MVEHTFQRKSPTQKNAIIKRKLVNFVCSCRHANFKTNQPQLTLYYFRETLDTVNFVTLTFEIRHSQNMKFPALFMYHQWQTDCNWYSKYPSRMHNSLCFTVQSVISWSGFCHSLTRCARRWLMSCDTSTATRDSLPDSNRDCWAAITVVVVMKSGVTRDSKAIIYHVQCLGVLVLLKFEISTAVPLDDRKR